MRDSVFKMLSLLLINSLWHAEYQLLGESLIDGDLFKHYQLQHARKWTDLNRIVPELLEENVFFPVWCHGEKKQTFGCFVKIKLHRERFDLEFKGLCDVMTRQWLTLRWCWGHFVPFHFVIFMLFWLFWMNIAHIYHYFTILFSVNLRIVVSVS